MKLEGYIKEYYPEWYGYQNYPADGTVFFCKVDEAWGILGNFAGVSLVVDGVPFDSTGKLYQVMKFSDPESRRQVYGLKGQKLKMRAKKREREGTVRPDWGRIFIDAMMFCLMEKYTQCEAFRQELERSKGLYIVEKEPNTRKSPGCWSASLSADGTTWTGPNIMGRLLMELRDTARLDYSLPADAVQFQDLA